MTKQANTEYNKELILVHAFIKKLHENYMHSNKIKSNNERLSFAHAVQILGYIAYNCNITDKPTPNTNKKTQIQRIQRKIAEDVEDTVKEHTELFDLATTD